MLKALKIRRLKLKAAKLFADYLRERCSMSCGEALGEEINPRLSDAKQAFNRTMDKLAEIDPTCPTARL